MLRYALDWLIRKYMLKKTNAKAKHKVWDTRVHQS